MASIQKRPGGRWRARFRDDSGREHAKHLARKVDAQRWLDCVAAQRVSGAFVDPRAGRMTLGTYADIWMTTRSHLKPKTRHGYEMLLNSRVLPRWGSVPLGKVSSAKVGAWVSELTAEGLSPSRIRQIHGVLPGVLDTAVRDRRIALNPAVGIKLPKPMPKQRRYLSHAQVDSLARECGVNDTLVLTLAYTGIRWGEAVALRVCNVDLERSRLHIRESAADVSGEIIVGSPKSHVARDVPLPAFLKPLIERAIAEKDPDDLVFAAPRGGYLRSSSLRQRSFDPAARAAGPDGLTPHELRHTAASLAIAAGATVKAVQRMLGHKTATLTIDLYRHLRR